MVADYAIITPCRNEARFLPRFIASVRAQTIPPVEWIIVDDGSTDETAAVLESAARDIPYLRVLRLPDTGARRLGGGVVAAFNAGLEGLSRGCPSYVCKLDADLDLPERYFETVLTRMESEPRLGSFSGKPYVECTGGGLVPEGNADDYSVGMAKFYRTECLRQIGGLAPAVMWDGIDVHEARRRGWKVRSDDTPDLRITHLRPMGSSDRGLLVGRVRWGRGQYFMGTAFVWMISSALYRCLRRPYLIGGLAMLFGYMMGAFARMPRYGDRAFRRYLRGYQYSCLLRGRRRTLELYESRYERAWSVGDDA